MNAPSLFLTAEQPFQAAREWPRGRLHGHGFRARAIIHEDGCRGEFPGDGPRALSQALADAVRPLDYGLINDHLTVTDDVAIAEWLLTRLPSTDHGLWLCSAPDRGAVVTAHGPSQHWVRCRFEAAHRLPNVPAGHQCGRMHGHGFEVVIEAQSPVEQVLSAWAPLHAELHHACLNDLPGLQNPTSEVLAAWLHERLGGELQGLGAVTVMETASAGCRFDGTRWRIWKSRSFDSAVKLAHAPDGDPRGRLHGHTFETRLHLTGELDTVLGWVEDYGDVKRRFDPLFRALDHHPLHEDRLLPDADAASIARRIDAEMAGHLPGLSRVDVLETPACGALAIRARDDDFGLLQP